MKRNRDGMSNKRVRIYALIAVIALLLSGCANADGKVGREDPGKAAEAYTYDNGAFDVSIAKASWDALEHEYCGFADAQDMLRIAAEGLDTIADATGESNWLSRYSVEDGKVTVMIDITDKGSYTEGGYDSKSVLVPKIYLNKRLLSHGMSPLMHELTHIVCQDYGSVSLREGLAAYMNDSVCDTPTVFNYGKDPDELCANIILADGQNQSLIGEMGSFDLTGESAKGDGRAAYYICSYSFVKYLIGEYGMDTFMRIYSSDNGEGAYPSATGKPLFALQNDWVKHLEPFTGTLSPEDFDKYITELQKAYGLVIS